MFSEVCILGDGAWGTSLAILLAKKGEKVTLWGNFPEHLKLLEKKRENTKYLPGFKIPENVSFEEDIKKAVLKSQIIIVAIPTKFFRKTILRLKRVNLKDKIFVSVSKGIEAKTQKRMSEILKEELKGIKIAVLSGPNIAKEIAGSYPSIAILASKNKKVLPILKNLFQTSTFRIDTCQDIVGVEMGGALKNVVAIASGIVDGLNLGANLKGVVISKGWEEAAFLAQKEGAKKETLYKPEILGDLIATSISKDSRNRRLGEKIAKNPKKDINSILNSLGGIPEGFTTSQAVFKMLKKHKIDLRILKSVYLILHKKENPKKIIEECLK